MEHPGPTNACSLSHLLLEAITSALDYMSLQGRLLIKTSEISVKAEVRLTERERKHNNAICSQVRKTHLTKQKPSMNAGMKHNYAKYKNRMWENRKGNRWELV